MACTPTDEPPNSLDVLSDEPSETSQPSDIDDISLSQPNPPTSQIGRNELNMALEILRSNGFMEYPDGAVRGSGITHSSLVSREPGEPSMWIIELYVIPEIYESAERLYDFLKQIDELTDVRSSVRVKPWLGPTPLA